jgi:hypothetical protein
VLQGQRILQSFLPEAHLPVASNFPPPLVAGVFLCVAHDCLREDVAKNQALRIQMT